MMKQCKVTQFFSVMRDDTARRDHDALVFNTPNGEVVCDSMLTASDTWSLWCIPDEPETRILVVSNSSLGSLYLVELELLGALGWREVYERTYYWEGESLQEVAGPNAHELRYDTLVRRALEYAWQRY